MFKRLTTLLAAAAIGLASMVPAKGDEKSPSFIRDAEIEATIRAYAAPLFAAAGLEPDAVRVYLVNDDRLNAFVAGGMKLFLHTGLLVRSESANQLIGVIAHETGHIAGGHLARAREAMETASIESIIAFVLGVGAAIASGDAGAGVGVVGAGQAISQQTLLQYTREQEAAADQAALGYLDATGQSARGMLEVLAILRQQEALLASRQDPYLRSHPLTAERINAVSEHVLRSPFTDKPEDPEFARRHGRMVAKLVGYLYPMNRVLQSYPETDASLEARYARAIAQYRAANLDQALALIDGLIAERPDDPYFQELKGQVLHENGRIREAIPYWERAVALAPSEPLLRFGLAQSRVAVEDPALNRAALADLEEVVRLEPRMPAAWRLLAVAYGRDGQIPMAALALAEAAAARGNAQEARIQAERAMKGLPEGSPSWLRANDILSADDGT